ncbi:carnitine dehydratase [Sulfolobus sp. A20]|nr:CaiB/BaiF CoA-transferase family protein [Sulfolobus sp. A20]AOL16588.1 carnitine dehydratase [Sulfolobus sp. A20]
MRVIELGHVIAAPFAGLILANLGFEVIKVEPLNGDPSRRDDVLKDSMFLFNNRGKKSVALNLKSEKGREIFLKLIKSSNVLIENYSEDTMEKLGLTKEVLMRENPSLVYCSIKGFPKGKYERKPAFGTIIEAMSGIMKANGNARLPASITDMGTSYSCVITVLWALLMNKPGYYRIDILQNEVTWLGYYIIAYQTLGKLFYGGRDELPFWAPYELFKTKDEKLIYIAINNNEKWSSLCKVLGLENLINDSRFESNEKRVNNRKVLHELIQDKIKGYTLDELLDDLSRFDIPASPLLDIPDLINENLVEWEEVDGLKIPKLPLPGSLKSKAPKLGEHTISILKELGYNENDIKEMIKDRVILV